MGQDSSLSISRTSKSRFLNVSTRTKTRKKTKKRKSAARYRIDVWRQRARLLDINGFPTCLTPRSYRYRSVTHEASERTSARCRGSIASGAQRRLSLSVIARALSTKFAAWHGGERRQGVAASTGGKLTRYRGLAEVRGAIEFSRVIRDIFHDPYAKEKFSFLIEFKVITDQL